MSFQSDAAKAHIEKLLIETYPAGGWHREYHFNKENLRLNPETKRWLDDWRFDYAVPSVLCAIEIQGGNFIRRPCPRCKKMILQGGGHANSEALEAWYERMNQAARLGWRVWQYTPEQVVKCKTGRKSMPDEIIPILKKLPWM